ncbi:MAG: tetratricopeptide repeat protein [Phycisphaerales bacterium]
MNAEQYRRAAKLFDEACDRPAAEREAFVRGRTGDADIGEHVLAMLAQDADDADTAPGFAATQWFDSDASAGASAAPAPAPATPERIDRYRILGLIGQGGMGRVFRAEQDQPRRTVALKLLRPSMFGPDLIKRFRNEAEFLGRLHHPGIARIYDAGTWDATEGPQPWYAMELVNGLPLNEHATAGHLDDDARLQLVAEVADAVHHAHESGIIHRDLKPENILVDGDGPKILDFGVARVTDADIRTTTVQTAAGQLIGTLEYMSPEQCLGDPAAVDARTDVYAIGVILHELLCGQRPHDLSGKSIPEAIRAIREDTPTRPSGLRRAVRGDLETIIIKALEKDPQRRYATARDLADDLRRLLADEPILARPPSAIYQLTKLARRHRAAAIAAVAIATILTAGTVTSTVFAIRASAARNDAQAATTDAVERAESLAAINLFTERMLEQADPWRAGGNVSVVTALNRAAANVETNFGAQPELEASVRLTIGRTYVGLGVHTEGQRHLRRAVELRTELYGVDAPETLAARVALAASTTLDYEPIGPDGELEMLLATCRRVLGPRDVLTRRAATHLATANQQSGDWPAAATLADAVLEATDLDRVASMDREEFELSIGAMIVRGWTDVFAGELDAADARFLAADEVCVDYGGASFPRRVVALNARAAVAADRRDWAAAEGFYRTTLRLGEEVLGNNHPDMSVALTGLAWVLEMSGKPEDSEPMHRRAIALLTGARGPDHRHTLIARTNLGEHLANRGRLDEASTILNDVIEVRRASLGADHPDVAASYNSLGLLYYRSGEMTAARDAFAAGVAIYDRIYERPNTDSITALVNLAATHRNLEAWDEAIPLQLAVLEYDGRVSGERSREIADGLSSLSKMLTGAGRLDEARERATLGLEIAREHDGETRIGALLDALGRVEWAAGNLGLARTHLAEAWQLYVDNRPGRQFAVAEALAEIAEASGDAAAAAEWKARATPPPPPTPTPG